MTDSNVFVQLFYDAMIGACKSSKQHGSNFKMMLENLILYDVKSIACNTQVYEILLNQLLRHYSVNLNTDENDLLYVCNLLLQYTHILPPTNLKISSELYIVELYSSNDYSHMPVYMICTREELDILQIKYDEKQNNENNIDENNCYGCFAEPKKNQIQRNIHIYKQSIHNLNIKTILLMIKTKLPRLFYHDLVADEWNTLMNFIDNVSKYQSNIKNASSNNSIDETTPPPSYYEKAPHALL